MRKKKYILLLSILFFFLIFATLAAAEVVVIRTQEIPYLRISRMRQEEGVVKIFVVVGKSGIPSSTCVLESSGYERLDQCAKHAIGKWLFLGVKEGTELIQPVEFRLIE